MLRCRDGTDICQCKCPAFGCRTVVYDQQERDDGKTDHPENIRTGEEPFHVDFMLSPTPFYSLTPTASSSPRRRLVHDLDVKRVYMDADLLADREHIRAVNQPFIAVRCGDFHLIVDALENQGG